MAVSVARRRAPHRWLLDSDRFSGLASRSGIRSSWNFVLAETDPNLVETDPNLAETDPNLAETDPNLAETDPNLAETDVNLAETDPNLASCRLWADRGMLFWTAPR